MRSSVPLAWAAALLGGGAALLVTVPPARSARERAAAACAELVRAESDVREIMALRAGLPEWTRRRPSDAALAPSVSAALGAAGLSASVLSSLTVNDPAAGESDAPAARRRATLALTSLTLPELGRFLRAWREREPDWVIASLDIGPEPDRTRPRRSAAPGVAEDLPLRAMIGLEALFMNNAGGLR
ncbi:MAG TPA: hypothetical protein VD963_09140 [Phycisphaerales bacterium]|nr:hypothetical protein [Phycisphaerales bacterium]